MFATLKWVGFGGGGAAPFFDVDAPAEPLACAETPSEGGAPDGGGGRDVPAPVDGAGFICCLYSE